MRRISKEQSRLAKINSVRSSRKLRRLYRICQRRFRHAVSAMVKTIVEGAHQFGISRIVIGRLKGIRDNSHGSKVNAMINNFWSFDCIIERFKEKAGDYGIKVVEVSEYRSSSLCPFCGSEGSRKHRGLFYCPRCHKVMNADVVDVLNIAERYGAIIPSPSWRDNGLVAQPLLLRWDGMRWEPRRAMKN
ncbi:MAG: zinc ribbon domain-containing protein [Thermoprotei archaeon]|jgi:putative transposase